MGDSAAPTLHLGLGFPVETEGGGLAATVAPERGKDPPPSSPTSSDDEDSSSSDDGEDWLVSDSEDEDHHEDEGTYRPYTIDDIPRPSCDPKKQSDVLYMNPDAKLRGPLPIRLFPAFKSGKGVFGSYYNLADTSPISVKSAWDCSNECQCTSMILLQFIDIKIAGYAHTHPGRAKIYGFVAARERADAPLRNYVYNRKIENCEAVFVKPKTGVARLSLMSPIRVIKMISRALIEFELHVHDQDKTNGDDGVIIEGCTELENMYKSQSFVEHRRIYSERCALDIKYMVLINAVEARVDVTVLCPSTIAGGINMKLYAMSGDFTEVIRLFQGAAPEPGKMMSFAVAAERHAGIILYIQGSPRDGPAPWPEAAESMVGMQFPLWRLPWDE